MVRFFLLGVIVFWVVQNETKKCTSAVKYDEKPNRIKEKNRFRIAAWSNSDEIQEGNDKNTTAKDKSKKKENDKNMLLIDLIRSNGRWRAAATWCQE